MEPEGVCRSHRGHTCSALTGVPPQNTQRRLLLGFPTSTSSVVHAPDRLAAVLGLLVSETLPAGLVVGTSTYPRRMAKLRAASRPANDTTAEPHDFEVDLDDHGGDYDEALASARASVPEGWVLLSVSLVD
jgi:hypothetical protein